MREAPAVLVVGLIGPIAAGKSVVLDEMERLGAFGVRADDVSRELLAPGSELLERVIAEFGEQYREDDGGLDRRALGTAVFADPLARGRLEQVVHPAMVARMAELIENQRARADRPEVMVIEAANLPQMGGVGLVDVTVQVTASPETRVRRLMARDGVSEEYARSLVALHDELGIGRFRAEYEVSTEGDVRSTRGAVQRLWGELVKAPG